MPKLLCLHSNIKEDIPTGSSIKPETWNIPEYLGTFRNISEHGIIIKIIRKICKIKFFKIKSNKNKLVSSRKINKKIGKKKENDGNE